MIRYEAIDETGTIHLVAATLKELFVSAKLKATALKKTLFLVEILPGTILAKVESW